MVAVSVGDQKRHPTMQAVTLLTSYRCRALRCTSHLACGCDRDLISGLVQAVLTASRLHAHKLGLHGYEMMGLTVVQDNHVICISQAILHNSNAFASRLPEPALIVESSEHVANLRSEGLKAMPRTASLCAGSACNAITTLLVIESDGTLATCEHRLVYGLCCA